MGAAGAEEGAAAEVHDWAHGGLFGEEADLGGAEAAGGEDVQGRGERDFLEHGGAEGGHGGLGDVAPDVVAEEEQAGLVDAGFGDVKVAADERDEEGVEEVVEEFRENLGALACLGLGAFVVSFAWGGEPFHVCDLGGVSDGKWLMGRACLP